MTFGDNGKVYGPEHTVSFTGAIQPSKYIYDRILTQLPPDDHTFCEVYIDTNMTHGLSYLSNFGLATTDTDTVRSYIVGRAAVFFQTIIINKDDDLIANSARSVFFDCENYRKAGYLYSDNATCPPQIS